MLYLWLIYSVAPWFSSSLTDNSRTIIRHIYNDFTKCFNLNKINFTGYAFQIEMKFTAWKHGFNIVEVPIIFTDRTEGQSKMSSGIFKEAILGVLSLKIRSWFRTYKKAA